MEYTEKQAKEQYEVGKVYDTLNAECGVEYTMPDYMPEIRKLLRVDARPIPSGRYFSEENAEFSGIVAFTVVYSDGEGRLCALSQNGEYTLTCRKNGALRDAFLDVEVEPAVCRLYGPRKIGLRTTVRGRAELIADMPLPSYPDAGLEMLTARREVRDTRSVAPTEIAFSDSLSVAGVSPEGMRLLSCDGALLFEDARPTADAVRLRGVAHIRILASAEDERPLSYGIKIPLECELSAEGARPTDSCLPIGCIATLNVRPTGDGEGGCRLEIDGVAECGARLYGNREIELVTDLYSPDYRTEKSTRQLALEKIVGAGFGNYTVSGTTPFPAGEERASYIPDATASATVRKVSTEGGRATVLGDVRVKLLLAGTPEGDEGRVGCMAAEINHPFRIEAALSVPEGQDVEYTASVTPITVRPRIEDGGYAADTELSLSLVATCRDGIAVVDQVELFKEERFTKQGGMVRVIYPSGEDTLWSLAERTHTTPCALAEANGLPYNDNAESALSASLDGISYLLLE